MNRSRKIALGILASLSLGFAVAAAVRRGRFGEVPGLVARLRMEHTAGDVHPGALVGVGLAEMAELESVGRLGDACAHGDLMVMFLASAGYSAQGLITMDVARLAWEVGDKEVLQRMADLTSQAAAMSPTVTRVAMRGVTTALVSSDPAELAQAAQMMAATERLWDGATALHMAGLVAARGRRPAAKELLEGAARRYADLGCARHAALARAGFGFSALFDRPAEPPGPRVEADELSRAERRVLGLVVEGFANGDIANALFVSKRTVESHLASLYRKLGVSTRVALVRAGRGSTEVDA